jgi:hypothetical protein
MEIRGWSLCSGEDGQFKLELGDHFDRNLHQSKDNGLVSRIRGNKYRRAVTHNIDTKEQKIWRK